MLFADAVALIAAEILLVRTCARCEDDQFGVYKAEELLERMEARAEEDERRRLEISSAAPPNVRLDLVSSMCNVPKCLKTLLRNCKH